MNWDISGDAQENKKMIKENQLVYGKIMRGFKPNIFKNTMHPHVIHQSVGPTTRNNKGLREEVGYTFKTYHELIQIYD